MKVFFDTEFIEDGRTIDLVSIGMVREDGATFYAEPRESNLGQASDWVRSNVLPHLRGGAYLMNRSEIAGRVIAFAGEKPEFWAYFSSYDWVVLCQLYGRMIDLPKGWPMWCRDVKQLAASLGDPALPDKSYARHYALADAEWTKKAHDFLIGIRP
jgi:hypothetical protein